MARRIERRMYESALALADALLERDHEVEEVRTAVRAVGQQVGAALMIEGAAGIGKSRLLDLARRDTRRAGWWRVIFEQLACARSARVGSMAVGMRVAQRPQEVADLIAVAEEARALEHIDKCVLHQILCVLP